MLRSFLLLNPIYTTLFWAVLLFFMDKKQNAARMMLCVFMCVSCLLYVSHYFFFQRICQVYAVFDGTYVGCSLAVYPLFHIYIRLLTVDRVFSFQKHIWYLAIPLLFMILIYGGYLFLSKEQSIEYVKNILPSAQFGHGVFGYLKRVYLISRLVFVFQCFFHKLHSFLQVPDLFYLFHKVFSGFVMQRVFYAR